jgi:chemotaxis signal transduction protein
MPDIPVTTPSNSARTPDGRFVVFTIGGERWALPVEVVSEVQQIAALTTLPEPDGALIGYLDLRGDVVAVVDGRILLGKEPVGLGVHMHLVVVTDGTARAAFVVDEVLGVIDAAVPQGGSAPGLAATSMGALVRDADGLIPLPDVAALIAAGQGSAAA